MELEFYIIFAFLKAFLTGKRILHATCLQSYMVYSAETAAHLFS